MAEMTLCEIIDGDKVLLKLATRGISNGKWNGLGGKIDDGETPEQCIIREVKEESGLTVSNPKKHGILRFYTEGMEGAFAVVHLFSFRSFSGKLTATDEGELRWFEISKIPYSEMWDDDGVWMIPLLSGFAFDGEFVFDKHGHLVDAHLGNMHRLKD